MTLDHPKDLFLLDACVGIPRRDNIFPKYLVQDINQIEELKEAKDSVIKEHLDKTNQILITSDYRFGLKMVLSGKKIVFVENGFDKEEIHVLYPSVIAGRGLFWSSLDIKCLLEG